MIRVRAAHACVATACLSLLGCLDNDLPEDASDERKVFIALEHDFRDFQDWMRFELRTAVMHDGIKGPVVAYLNRLPPRDADAFPVGTIIAKTVEVGPTSEWSVHAMAKRGGGFNERGAFGWEFFDLRVGDDSVPHILWRGEKPPSDHGYESLLGGANTTDMDCNACHATSDGNDAVLSDELSLDALR